MGWVVSMKSDSFVVHSIRVFKSVQERVFSSHCFFVFVLFFFFFYVNGRLIDASSKGFSLSFYS